MDNDQIAGIILTILGIVGMAQYKLDFENMLIPSIVTLLIFILGLYLFLKKF